MSSPPRILLDCDPGIDDAFAILCALRFTDLAAITTVSGNVPIEHTTRNALYVLDLANAEVPVHSGAAQPLLVPAMFAEHIHGAAGLGAIETPVPRREPSSMHAVEAIVGFCAAGNATIVATGPLTNIALALQHDPTLAERIDQLHWMGGSTGEGNVTPHAEFNAWADPHALAVVLDSGTSLTMYGLNLTHQVRMTGAHIETLRNARTPTSTQAAEFLSFFQTRDVDHRIGQPMHDPCALLGLTHPALFNFEESSMIAEVDGERRGRTEERSATSHTTAHRIARTADAPAVIDLIIEAAKDPSWKA